jgi:hypothetical protein
VSPLYAYSAQRMRIPMLSLRDVRLTLGLMGLDELHLRVLSTSSEDETERKNAAQGAPQITSVLWLGLLTQYLISCPQF